MRSDLLVLIRHAAPRIKSGVPAAEWGLSQAGRERCKRLCERLREYGLHRIVSSTERKAVETGALVAAGLRLDANTHPGLHEHERRSAPHFPSQDAFVSAVTKALRRPGELVLGEETADAAHDRFAAAVRAVLEEHPGERIGVVAHGTVIALLIARANRLDPVAVWGRLGMPSFAVLTSPTYDLIEIVGQLS